MEQMRQNEAGALTAQAIPQKDVEQACFHALGLIGRNCEYLDQHLAHVGADQQTRQAVNDISAASARLDRTVNEVMSLLDFLRTEEDPRLYPLDLCQLLQQVAAQADMVQAQLGVELTLDYGGWTACRPCRCTFTFPGACANVRIATSTRTSRAARWIRTAISTR